MLLWLNETEPNRDAMERAGLTDRVELHVLGVVENLARFLDGQPLLHAVDRERGY